MNFLSHPLLQAIPYLRHGFFTRDGGASEGIYASLNCGPGSKDAPEKVQENRRRVVEVLAPSARLRTAYQVHSNLAAAVHASDDFSAHCEVDALITEESQVVLGVLTADCVPILVADKTTPRVATIHAGWKGAFTGIIENTVKQMEERGSKRSNLVAAIGPCIQQPSYEVDSGFYQQFLMQNKNNQKFFIPSKKAGHYQFAVADYAKHRLEEARIGAIGVIEEDTYSQPEKFFSFRRTTHRQELDYGRQISAIVVV